MNEIDNIKSRQMLSAISPNLINDEIYSGTELDDLMLSLETNGQLESIVLNRDNTILSGHRRYFSMLQLNWTECDVRYIDVESDVVALIEFNRHRIKSVNDILNESRFLEKEFKRQIGRGRTATKQRQGKKMETIIEVSKKLGLSTTQLKKIKSINNYEPSLISKIDKGDYSVNQAYQIVRQKYIKKTTTDDKQIFSRRLSKLLKEHSPSNDEINQVLRRTFPYSVSNIEDGEDLRDELIHNLNTLKKLDEREIVSYRKFKEIEASNYNQKVVDDLETQLWSPTDITNKELTIEEIKNITPVIEVCEGEEFEILRTMIHSMEWVRSPGRLITLSVRNENDRKLLGVLTIASDMLMVENRDNYIGWTEKERLRSLRHLAVVSSCVATQPLGFNFLGGKLLASLSTSSVIRDMWKSKYGDTLIGLTTTSLFGQFSMYNSTRVWKSLGETKGTQLLKADSQHYNYWRDWLKENFAEEYELAISKSSPKQNVLSLIYRYLGIDKKKYMTETRKGLYFADIYENGRDFLNDEISEDDLVVNSKYDENILDWWQTKAIKRYSKLHDEGRLDNNSLWYNNLDDNKIKSWFSARGI